MRVEHLQREYDVRVEYVNFPLHPGTPMAGQSLAELFGGGPGAEARIRQSQTRLRALAEAEGLPMSDRTMTYNSRLAQELGRWAADRGRGPAFHDAAFRAYFAEGKNIADTGVLADLAESVGLDRAEALQVLEDRSYREAVDADWARAVAAGVNAVPTFQADGRTVVGAQPYAVLETLVRQAGAHKRQD